MNLYKAQKQHSSLLAQLYHSCFDNDIWQEKDFETKLNFPHILFLIAENNAKKPLGLLCYQYSLDNNQETKDNNEAEIILIGTHRKFTRKGIASHLLQGLQRGIGLTQATDKRIIWQNIFLDVAEDNLAAIALYHKHGYQTYGKRPCYYPRAQGKKIDALLMKKIH